MFVMKYYEDGDYLYSYIDEVHEIDWKMYVEILWGICAITCNGPVRGNLHGGNLWFNDEGVHFADVEPQCPVDSNEIHGVLPYIAPEILKGNPPTKASDVYSFGIIMWMISSGIRPWCNRPHDLKLASEICMGLRPKILDGTPKVYIRLMKRCWHSDPLKRPTASRLYSLLGKWVSAICDDPNPSKLSEKFNNIEKKKILDSEKRRLRQRRIHSRAFYTNRLLYFPELMNPTKAVRLFTKGKI